MGIRHVLIFIPNAHFIKVLSSPHIFPQTMKKPRLSNIPILPLKKGFLSLQRIWTLYASTSWSLAGQGAYSGPAPLLVLLRLSPAPRAAPRRVLSEPPWHIHCGLLPLWFPASTHVRALHIQTWASGLTFPFLTGPSVGLTVPLSVAVL